MTVSKFVAFLSWASFFVALWFGFSAESITPYQWFVVAVSFFIGVVSGLWRMERK